VDDKIPGARSVDHNAPFKNHPANVYPEVSWASKNVDSPRVATIVVDGTNEVCRVVLFAVRPLTNPPPVGVATTVVEYVCLVHVLTSHGPTAPMAVSSIQFGFDLAVSITCRVALPTHPVSFLAILHDGVSVLYTHRGGMHWAIFQSSCLAVTVESGTQFNGSGLPFASLFNTFLVAMPVYCANPGN
jgi:hypothetical protein